MGFQIFAEIEMTQNKNLFFGCHFKTEKKIVFSLNMVVVSVYTYGVYMKYVLNQLKTVPVIIYLSLHYIFDVSD